MLITAWKSWKLIAKAWNTTLHTFSIYFSSSPCSINHYGWNEPQTSLAASLIKYVWLIGSFLRQWTFPNISLKVGCPTLKVLLFLLQHSDQPRCRKTGTVRKALGKTNGAPLDASRASLKAKDYTTKIRPTWEPGNLICILCVFICACMKNDLKST